MNNRTLISVIIPSYNRADTVGETIESILAQKVDADIEIVIGDDCSTDNAREVLEQYRRQHPDIIRLFLREKNMGLGANWAQCVKDCRGEFICNCDNDDYWHNPDKLQLQLDYMRTHPNCNILITNHRTHNRSTGEIQECTVEIDHTDIQEYMYSGCHFCNATIMYRADFMKAHLNLDVYIQRRFTLQDWPTWVILAAYTDVDLLPVSTATFGIDTVSISRPDSVERLAKRYEGDKEVCRYLGELFPDKYPFSEDEWNLYVNGRLCAKAFDLGQFETAQMYGNHCTGISSVKRLCSQHRWLFFLFCKLRSWKRRH